MNIRKYPANAGNVGGTRAASGIRYIVIHYTGNDGDTAMNNAKYYAGNVVKTSAHYFVDANEIVQSVDDLRVAWAVGGKKYPSCPQTGGGTLHGRCLNANSISIELCDAKKDGVYAPSAKAVAQALELTKALMKKYNIPTAAYETFTDADEAIAYIKKQNSFPAVIKCDGLALGKGVIIAKDEQEAENAVRSMLLDGKFGKSGSEIVVEEFMTGPEVTVLAFTDGKTVKPMISSMDHKRAYDNDEGLNTGGMGTIAPNPLYTPDKQQECMEKIFLPTIKAMAAEGRPFKGCLYFGLMLTPNGAKVIEYNCRFGDPETQVVLPLLETDIMDIIEAVWEEKLDTLDIKWSDKSCACVVMASGGYPEKYETGKVISGLDENGQCEGAFVYHAGTKLEDGKFLTAGGRVLGITAYGDTLKEALDTAYKAVDTISFEKAHYRHDIGKKALSALK